MDRLDTGLALSGGGFRATLFGLGALMRLNELGWLRKLDVVTSVSGGSILNGALAHRWNRLEWSDPHGDGRVRAVNFQRVVVEPVRAFCCRTIDVAAGLEGFFSPFSTIADRVSAAYDEHLFHGASLQDLPVAVSGQAPRFVFYATSLQSGASVRISRKYLADWRVGRIDAPRLSLARVVAASSAFPPVLSPVPFDLDPALWQPLPGADLHAHEAYRRRLMLTDGGVYDNMGLEAIWDRCSTVLVSDAGAPFDAQPEPATGWTGQLKRVLDIVTQQTRALRKRELVSNFQEGRRSGTYWGISTRIQDYALQEVLAADTTVTGALSDVRTRLDSFSDQEQCQLIDWGYALCDAAMRRHVDAGAPAGRLPMGTHPLR